MSWEKSSLKNLLLSWLEIQHLQLQPAVQASILGGMYPKFKKKKKKGVVNKDENTLTFPFARIGNP